MPRRYRIHAGDLLRRLIDHPAEGEPGSIRELAEAAGLSKSKVQALVDEDRPTVAGDEAERIAGAYHLAPRALFHPVSTSRDMDTDPVTSPHKEAPSADGDEPRGEVAPRPSRLAHELGEHPRPEVADGEGPRRG